MNPKVKASNKKKQSSKVSKRSKKKSSSSNEKKRTYNKFPVNFNSIVVDSEDLKTIRLGFEVFKVLDDVFDPKGKKIVIFTKAKPLKDIKTDLEKKYADSTRIDPEEKFSEIFKVLEEYKSQYRSSRSKKVKLAYTRFPKDLKTVYTSVIDFETQLEHPKPTKENNLTLDECKDYLAGYYTKKNNWKTIVSNLICKLGLNQQSAKFWNKEKESEFYYWYNLAKILYSHDLQDSKTVEWR